MAEPANPNAQPTRTPTNKTLAATGGSAVGGAIATIVIYLIEQHSSKLPEPVAGAITVLIASAVTFLAGYLTPPGTSEGVVRDPESGKALPAR